MMALLRLPVTITLVNETFTSVNGSALGAVTNVPSGLTAVLVRASNTTATLSFTGTADAHANADDISNLTVTFSDSDFTYSTASEVTNATKTDLSIDFADPDDVIAPTLTSSTPSDNSTSVPVDGSGVLTFSENVVAGTGNIVITNENDSSDTRTIAIDDSTQITISGKTVTINPTADLNANTSYNVQLASGVINDSAGNAYAGISNATTLNFSTSDTISPTVSISSDADDAALKTGDVAGLTITLSESATDFTVDDINVSGGTLSNFSGTGKSYTVDFTPTANSTTAATVDITANKFTDAAGNNNTAATQLTMTVDTVVPPPPPPAAPDTTAPTVSISSDADDAALKTGDVAGLTITLSESATDFTVDDINVSGGTLSNFSGTGKSYTVDFTPTANSTTAATVDITANKFTDAAGNNNTAATQLTMTVDTVVPSPPVSIVTEKTIDGSGVNISLPANIEFIAKGITEFQPLSEIKNNLITDIRLVL
ncbi:MAG: Ig-like domain-containing protein [Methylococcales bacterium]|nr:Ig-like domain-containing protein [Methylococcales bacterium]